MDAPHTASCLECHKTHVLFGNQIGSRAGNANLCQSCHQTGGLAPATPMTEGDQAEPWPGLPVGAVPGGTSHRWDSSCAGRVIGLGASPAEALVPGGTYAGRYPKTYTVTISTDGDVGTALFNWAGTVPGGGSGAYLLTGQNVLIESGLTLSFLNSRTNSPAFRAGDSWQVLVRPGLTPPAHPAMVNQTAGGTVVCSTCHDQHSQVNEPFDPAAPPFTGSATSGGRHFMRVNNDQDQMCAECHGSRFVTNSTAGSHPVGMLVASNAYYRPPTSLPLDKTAGRVRCSTCHQVHQSPANDGSLLRLADRAGA